MLVIGAPRHNLSIHIASLRARYGKFYWAVLFSFSNRYTSKVDITHLTKLFQPSLSSARGIKFDREKSCNKTLLFEKAQACECSYHEKVKKNAHVWDSLREIDCQHRMKRNSDSNFNIACSANVCWTTIIQRQCYKTVIKIIQCRQ